MSRICCFQVVFVCIMAIRIVDFDAVRLLPGGRSQIRKCLEPLGLQHQVTERPSCVEEHLWQLACTGTNHISSLRLERTVV